MKSQSESQRVRIYIGETDKHGSHPLYEAIVEAAREHHLAGATVMRGLMGFGSKSHMHTAKVLRLSENLPVVVEIVDTPEKVAEFLPALDELITDGLVTVEPVQATAYRQNGNTTHG